MAVTRFKDSSVVDGDKYISFLAGNPTYVPPGFESIATVTPSGVSTITFSDIPQNYISLQLRIIGRSNLSGSPDNLFLRFNGDTASNYWRHNLIGNGSTVTASGQNASTMYAGFIPGSTATSNTYGAAIVDIHDYASTTRNKTVRALSGFDVNGSGEVHIRSNLWLSTSAVTSITVLCSTSGSTTFVSGTSIALYGIKGAA